MTTWKKIRTYHLRRLSEAMKKGEVDIPAVPMLRLINSVDWAVTTSSCSGRIVLLSTGKDEKKSESAFHRKWHRPVMVEEVVEGINSYRGEYLWLKLDPFIFHISTDTLSNAYRIVSIARASGIKIAGIQSISKNRAHVEIRGIDSVSIPVVWGGRRIADEQYVKDIVHILNKKLVRNQKRLEALYNNIKEEVEKWL